MKITEEIIQAELSRCLAKARKAFLEAHWAHPFSKLTVEMLATKYGEASRDGTIRISSAFLNTPALAQLTNTLLHEIAHLIVGLKQGHNKQFRHALERLLESERLPSEALKQSIKNNTPYKYRLLAYTSAGQVLDLGGAYRRTKRYLQYKGNHSFKGIRIDRYEYVNFCSKLPELTICDENLKD
ncbi:SprT-like domain-containing protein [Salinimonas chungwhensis]|uniref:SprT-like domain-containing protein n=1 Tax=Salinimonas chungwhensis TaxID=265425 RepID=UPI00035D551B|nr:SprT-like domain-containing protein [Salinimonas chungwhensis]